MRVLQIEAIDQSGAGRAALRLHQGLLMQGTKSTVLTARKTSHLEAIVQPKHYTIVLKQFQQILVGKWINRYLERSASTFSVNASPSHLLKQIQVLKPDLINLHWIGWEFLRIEDLIRLQIPLVWTLHDMWAFTGGCHYSQDCDRYLINCGNCPQLQTIKDHDLSRWVWQRKARAWKNLNLTLVTPSSWLSRCATSSALFHKARVEIIPNGLDTHIYKPLDQQFARNCLNLPQNKTLILFGAVNPTGDPRKGFHLLNSALQRLRQTEGQHQIELVIFGASQPGNSAHLGFPTHYLGRINDDISLALVYAAADVMVVPSIQEAFGQTASEALACGRPVVAFKATGLEDIVDHCQTGYLAKPYESDDLARGIAWVLEDSQRYQMLGTQARQKAEQEFTLERQAQRYLALYTEILEQRFSTME